MSTEQHLLVTNSPLTEQEAFRAYMKEFVNKPTPTLREDLGNLGHSLLVLSFRFSMLTGVMVAILWVAWHLK